MKRIKTFCLLTAAAAFTACSGSAYVDIDKDVVIVGNKGYFEVWDAKRYDKKFAEVDLSLLFH